MAGLGVPRHTTHNLAPYHPIHLKDILQKKEENTLINLTYFVLCYTCLALMIYLPTLKIYMFFVGVER